MCLLNFLTHNIVDAAIHLFRIDLLNSSVDKCTVSILRNHTTNREWNWISILTDGLIPCNIALVSIQQIAKLAGNKC